MANVIGSGIARVLVDSEGDPVNVTATSLDVNETGAALIALQKIDDIQDTIGTTGQGGPSKAISIAGTMSGGNLRELTVDGAGRLDVDATSESDNAIGTSGNAGPSKAISIAGTESDGTFKEVAVTSNGYLQVNLKTASASGSASDPFKVDPEGYDAGSAGIMTKVVCSDTLAALSGVTNAEISSLQVDTQGALYTTHGMTGMVQGNTTVGTSAMQLDEGTDGYAVSCKRVDLMSDPNNAGHIYIGSADTISANGSVGGIRLNPGDFYSFDINNLTHIWVEASEVGQELNFIYYT